MNANPEFRWAVDFPMSPLGNSDRILLILAAAERCVGGASVETFGMPPGAEVQQWFNRVWTRCPEEADRLARQFRMIGAKRVPNISPIE